MHNPEESPDKRELPEGAFADSKGEGEGAHPAPTEVIGKTSIALRVQMRAELDRTIEHLNLVPK